MKTGKKFIQVIIKSSADFPEKEGEYFCNRSGFMTVQKLKRGLPDKSYQREIRWYLIEQPQPDPKTAEEYSPRVANLIIQIRDLFVQAEDTPLNTMNEIWHLLYQIASPDYDKLIDDVWKDLENTASQSTKLNSE